MFFIFFFIFIFFFNDTATTEIYTLSLHDALPICGPTQSPTGWGQMPCTTGCRSEEHTSELQSRRELVCRLLLEKKKKSSRIPRNCTPRNPPDNKMTPHHTT